MEELNLVFLGEQGQPVTDSLKVAQTFGKEHYHVIRDIRSLIGGISNFGDTPLFKESNYINPQNGQQYPMYIMTRDGFTLLAMGFTGKKALAFKIKYIEAFNRMEQQLKQGIPGIESNQSLKDFAKRVYESECEKERMAEELARTKRDNFLLQEECKSIIPRLEKLEQQLVSAAPLAEPVKPPVAIPAKYADKLKGIRIKDSRTIRSLHPDYLTVSEFQKWLQKNGVHIGRPDLFAFFRVNGYISKDDDTYNRPTEISIENGWMVPASSGTHKEMNDRRYFIPFITPEGRDFFRERLLEVTTTRLQSLFAGKKGKGEQS